MFCLKFAAIQTGVYTLLQSRNIKHCWISSDNKQEVQMCWMCKGIKLTTNNVIIKMWIRVYRLTRNVYYYNKSVACLSKIMFQWYILTILKRNRIISKFHTKYVLWTQYIFSNTYRTSFPTRPEFHESVLNMHLFSSEPTFTLSELFSEARYFDMFLL